MALNIYLIANIITCVCALFGFIYGIIHFFKPKKAVYAQMITLAAGSMMFGRLYQVVRLLTGGGIIDEFQLGSLGMIGTLLFFFSANFGLMDSLADDGSKQFAKYRIIPLAAPITAAALYFFFVFLADVSLFAKIMGAVTTVFVMPASYYNLKHLIFPDVDYGIIKCLQSYNLLALIFSLTCLEEVIAVSRYSEPATLIIGIIMGALLLVIVPAVKRGMKKWTI